MLLQIPQILNQQLTSELRRALHRIEWTPVINRENNQNNNPNNVINFFQLPEQSIEAKYFAGQIISAVENSPLFISSSLPKKIYPPIFRKFCENQGYSTRIDNAVKQIPGMPIRVRLDQRTLGGPVIAVVQAINDPELGVILEHAVQQFCYEGSDLVANASAVAACRGDYPEQRVVTLASPGLDHVVHGAGLMRMQLVYATEVDV